MELLIAAFCLVMFIVAASCQPRDVQSDVPIVRAVLVLRVVQCLLVVRLRLYIMLWCVDLYFAMLLHFVSWCSFLWPQIQHEAISGLNVLRVLHNT